MRVPDDAEPCIKSAEIIFGSYNVRYILPGRLPGATVHDGKIVLHQQVGQSRQESPILSAQLSGRPAVGLSRLGAEIADINFPHCCRVVIAANADRVKLLEQFYTGHRVRSIAHHITYAPGMPESTVILRILQHGLEGLEVAVDIGDDEVFQ